MVYGVTNNPKSVLSSPSENFKKDICERGKKILLYISSFLINRGFRMFYIETDEIYTVDIPDSVIDELKDNIKKLKLIDCDVSPINKEKTASFIIMQKKRLLVSRDGFSKGMEMADDQEVLSSNKKYFGQLFPEIFPEYAF